MRARLSLLSLVAFLVVVISQSVNNILQAAEPANRYLVGVSSVDIMPDYPVRLSGFAGRRAESEGVTQRIWAKALAIAERDGEPAVLVTVDNLGVPATVVNEVANRLAKSGGLKRERLAITATHTHTGPMLKDTCATLFGAPIPADHQERIDRYTAELTKKLEQVALAALQDRRPARLSWGVGTVRFAMNRRNRGGPVDHDLPVLVVRDLAGAVRAIYVSYACHCVTLSNNKISGDWAGYAQEAIQREFPGTIALVSIGCGADSNPNSGVTGDKADVGASQGAEIAAEVKRLVGGFLAPVRGPLTTSLKTMELPLAELPTHQQWEERAKRNDAAGYHAQVNLARLDRGESLPTKIDYAVQSWSFGDSLVMVFLPGEVVVDYSQRLKRELDGRRLWINAYANDAPCYIPSERVLREGGYEGGGAMIYYDVPAPLAPGLEEKIVGEVRRQIGDRFAAPFAALRTGGALPLSPQQSQAAIRVSDKLRVELVAAEPLVVDPVAIDFGPGGKLWVCEMHDYPSGLPLPLGEGRGEGGGRIRVLTDEDADGRFDHSSIFLDNLPFPTGVTVWRGGVLVCAAPDILYAEDTNGDGRADVVKKLFSGFGTGNFQARVNSLCYGLDGWVYGSCGLFGGKITNFKGQTFDLGDRDFRIKPDKGELEPASGRSQQGRVRDDWDNWFGCDNSDLCRHYPLAEHYLRRNPHVTPPPISVIVPAGPDSNQLFPLAETQRFKLSGPPGRVTAACGLGVYRDELLGAGFTGNVFTCEPVNLVVHRRILSPAGSTFTGRRADDEQDREFLASTDNWFRPVQAVTGPDGALWIVDMCRYVIEHPRWIPPEDLQQLDVRAGDTLGRIYRVLPRDSAPRPWPRLDKLEPIGLVAALDSPNGWQRDMASQMLLWEEGRGQRLEVRKDEHPPAASARSATAATLESLVTSSRRAEARLHALCVLDGLKALRVEIVEKALADSHPGVRRHAIRLSEPFLNDSPKLMLAVAKLVDDLDPLVRLQVACTMGSLTRPERAHFPGAVLREIAIQNTGDPFLTAAAMSSLNEDNVQQFCAGLLRDPRRRDLVELLVVVAVGLNRLDVVQSLLSDIATTDITPGSDARYMEDLAGLLDALNRKQVKLASVLGVPSSDPVPKPAKYPVRHDVRLESFVDKQFEKARGTAQDNAAAPAMRLASIRLLARDATNQEGDLKILAGLLSPRNASDLQAAALASLGKLRHDKVFEIVTAGWPSYTPIQQTQVLDLILSRDAWLPRLLDRIEAGEIPVSHLDAARRQRLLSHKDEALRARAAKLLAGTTNPDRQKVVDDHRDVATLAGDRQRGRAVFDKKCAACHRSHETGHAVGPDLAALANKSPQYLLQEILDPNKNVDSRYVQYVAATNDGRIVVGLLAGESATSLTLKGPEGKEFPLLRSELDELQATSKSLMPEGLEKDLSHQDLADLIALLSSPATSPKKFAGNVPAIVKPADGKLALLATNAEIYGGEIVFEAPLKNIGYWHGVQDHVVWTVQLDEAGEFDVYLDYSCDNESAGNAFVLEGIDPAVRGAVVGTGGWDKYVQKKIGITKLAAGTHRLKLRPDGDALRGALFDLRGVHFVPRGSNFRDHPK